MPEVQEDGALGPRLSDEAQEPAAHVATAKEEEPTLLKAKVSSIQILSSSPTGEAVKAPPPVIRAPVVDDAVELVEARVFVHLDGDGPSDDGLWYLDTGVTNHMTRSRPVFSELDHSIVGTVRFGDGSVVKIEDCGTVLFTCKTGEHKRLTGVYFIPRLDTNLISVR
jgi:hypothetical protein